MIQLFVLAFAFVLLSGVMAVTEAAVLSVSMAEVEVMVGRKEQGARILQVLKQRITRVVVVLVVITNTINILGPVIVGTTAVRLYGNAVVGIVTAVLTFATIVFSEIIPKSLGTHYAPQISRAVAPVLRVIVIVLFPAVVFFEWLTALLQRGERRVGTEEQIRSLVRLGHSAGYIEPDEHQLVHRAFELNDRHASDIMTPMAQVRTLPADLPIRGAIAKVLDSPYTRYPVTGKNQQVVGQLVSHRLLRRGFESEHEDPQSQPLVRDIMDQPFFISPTDRADDLLLQFRNRKAHLAIVLEAGTPVGVVTLEDVLEELVGEISDEKGI